MAEATLRFLTDTAFQMETRRKAYQYAKPMFWPNVGLKYLEFFTQVVSDRETPVDAAVPQGFRDAERRAAARATRTRRSLMQVGESIALNHLDRMTDSTGLIQHAIYSIPRRESGYTTDDNARALRLCVRLWDQHPEEQMLKRVTTYLSFLEYARGIGRGFHNFLSYDRRWLDAEGCGDCQGQAVRSLAEVLGSGLPDGYRALARELIDAVLPTLADLRSLPRSSVCDPGIGTSVECGGRRHRTSGNRGLVRGAATRGMLLPCRAARLAVVRVADDLCQRGIAARAVRRRQALAEGGLPGHSASIVCLPRPSDDCRGSLLAGRERGLVSPWRGKGRRTINSPWKRSRWPRRRWPRLICSAAEEYLATFRRAHGWFHGRNSLKQPLVDVRSGACCDGLQASGVNRNQGAESTLAYLWAEMSNAKILRLCGDSPWQRPNSLIC